MESEHQGDQLGAAPRADKPEQPAPAVLTLEELMAAYDPEKHRHDEIDWGVPVGSEIW